MKSFRHFGNRVHRMENALKTINIEYGKKKINSNEKKNVKQKVMDEGNKELCVE